MVAVKAHDVKVVDVFAISVHVENALTDDCHFVTDPVFPDKVNNAMLLPEQIVVPPATVPATVVGETVTVVATEFAAAQLPL